MKGSCTFCFSFPVTPIAHANVAIANSQELSVSKKLLRMLTLLRTFVIYECQSDGRVLSVFFYNERKIYNLTYKLFVLHRN